MDNTKHANFCNYLSSGGRVLFCIQNFSCGFLDIFTFLVCMTFSSEHCSTVSFLSSETTDPSLPLFCFTFAFTNTSLHFPLSDLGLTAIIHKKSIHKINYHIFISILHQKPCRRSSLTQWKSAMKTFTVVGLCALYDVERACSEDELWPGLLRHWCIGWWKVTSDGPHHPPECLSELKQDLPSVPTVPCCTTNCWPAEENRRPAVQGNCTQ